MKANARSNIDHVSPINGLKAYGKPIRTPPVRPGDLGFVEELGRFSRESNPGKTHAFFPSKWGYTWMFPVGPEDFTLL